MSSYIIVLSKKAQKQLDAFSDNIANQIIAAITQLEINPKPIGCKKLKGRDGYRISTGN